MSRSTKLPASEPEWSEAEAEPEAESSSESEEVTQGIDEPDPWRVEGDLWRRRVDEDSLPAFALEELTPSLVPIQFRYNRLSAIPQLDDILVATRPQFSSGPEWAGDELDGAEVYHRIKEHLSLAPSAQASTLKPQGVFEVSAPPEGQWMGEAELDQQLAQMPSTRPASALDEQPSPQAMADEAQLLADQRVARHRVERLDAELREAERLDAELREAERLDAELREAERLDAELREAERLDAELREAERLDAELREAERLDAELREAERLEALREQRLLKTLSAEEILTYTFARRRDAEGEDQTGFMSCQPMSLPPLAHDLERALLPDPQRETSDSASPCEGPLEREDEITQPPLMRAPQESIRRDRADRFHTERAEASAARTRAPSLRLRSHRRGQLKRCYEPSSHSSRPDRFGVPKPLGDGLEALLSLRPLQGLYL